MFYHIKDLQFNARVMNPDARFASLLQEQFGGGNGELKAAMQYFVQAFGARQPFPKHYDLLMDIATEEFSHLEIVGATITMLLDGINGELKNASEQSHLSKLLSRSGKKDMIEMAAGLDPQFFVLSGGGPKVTDAQGVPWSGAFVNANGDLTVDLRSNIAAESRAKIVYEYLMQFTDDPEVKNTLNFLMTREIAHFQQFSAALAQIEPNFPPGVLQGDPKLTHVYFNLSQESVRGPWNEGSGPWGNNEHWEYIEDPISHVRQGKGQHGMHEAQGPSNIEELNKQMSKMRSEQVKKAMDSGQNAWYETTAVGAGLPWSSAGTSYGTSSGSQDRPSTEMPGTASGSRTPRQGSRERSGESEIEDAASEEGDAGGSGRSRNR